MFDYTVGCTVLPYRHRKMYKTFAANLLWEINQSHRKFLTLVRLHADFGGGKHTLIIRLTLIAAIFKYNVTYRFTTSYWTIQVGSLRFKWKNIRFIIEVKSNLILLKKLWYNLMLVLFYIIINKLIKIFMKIKFNDLKCLNEHMSFKIIRFGLYIV